MPVKAGSESKRQACKPLLGRGGKFGNGMLGGKCLPCDLRAGCVSCASMLLILTLSQDLNNKTFKQFGLSNMVCCRMAS